MSHDQDGKNHKIIFSGIKRLMILESCYVASGIKVGRCNQLNEYMKLYEYQRSRSFIDSDHSDSIFLNFFSSVTADFNISSALR